MFAILGKCARPGPGRRGCGAPSPQVPGGRRLGGGPGRARRPWGLWGGRRRDLVKGAAEPAWVGLGDGLRCQGPVRGPSPPRFSLSSPPAGACSRPWHIWPGRTPSTRRTCSWCTMAPRAPAAPRARPGVPATWLPPPWKVRPHRAPCERQSHAVPPCSTLPHHHPTAQPPRPRLEVPERTDPGR